MSKAGGITLRDFQTILQSSIIIVWCWHKNRHVDQCEPKNKPTLSTRLLTKEQKVHSGKDVLTTNELLGKLDSHMQKNETRP